MLIRATRYSRGDSPGRVGRAVALALVCGLVLAWSARAAEVLVFAAASLTDSLKEIAGAYQKVSGDQIVFNLGASSFLERQIEEGAPADIFFSADEAKMDRLERNGLIVPETRRSRLSNSLVIVVSADSWLTIGSPRDLAGTKVKRLALADPRTVPAGIYSKLCLQRLGLWPAIAPKVIPTDNVRAALAAVESGNVEVGMVYKTDAAVSKRVRIAYAIAAREGPAISYPMALVKGAREPAGRKFLRYLDAEAAGRIFEKFGFIVLGGEGRQAKPAAGSTPQRAVQAHEP